MTAESIECPECGFSETGRFCRRCGKLLHREPLVLCPRCHQPVPDARFCHTCGQILTRSALRLSVLEELGEAFWVPSGDEDSRVSVPEWLAEFPQASPAPTAQYTDLSPVPTQRVAAATQPFVLLGLALLVVLVAGIVGLLVWLLWSGFGG